MNKKINVLIIGESNSVMRNGWVDGFKQAFNIGNVECRAIGGTGILHIIYQLNNLSDSIKDFDILILDHFINDFEFYNDRIDRYQEIFNKVYNYLESFKIGVIVVGFSPHKVRIEKIKNNIYDFASLNLSKRDNFIFYDFDRKLFESSDNDLASYKNKFLDQTHPHREVSFALGMDLANHIQKNISTWPQNFTGENVKLDSYFSFGFIGVEDLFEPSTTFDVVNSLVNMRGYFIKEKDLICQVPEELQNSTLIGLFLDASKCVGLLRIESQRDYLDKNLTFKQAFNYKTQKALPPLIWAKPIVKEIKIFDSIKLSCLKEPERGFEITHSAMNNLNRFCIINSSLGIIGFIVEK